jgi:hypothetical protein
VTPPSSEPLPPSGPPSPPPAVPAPDVIAYRTRPRGILFEGLRALSIICFGYDLFLSHRHANREYALRLWPRLEERGLITCFDATEFHVGQRLRLTMRRTVADSSALLLVDTDEARESTFIPLEVASAIEHARPIIPIRQQELGPNPWPGVDDDDELLYAEEPRENFLLGVPSEAVIDHIVRRHHAIRVRTWFLLSASVFGLALMGLAGYAWLEREFRSRVGLVYAAMSQPTSTIADAENAFTDLNGSWVVGWFGRSWRKRELDMLRSALDGLWIKAVESTPLMRALDLAHAEEHEFGAFSHAAALAVGPDDGVITLTNEGRTWRRGSDEGTCHLVDRPMSRLALTPSGGVVAGLTTRSIYLWRTARCRDEPERAELPEPIDAARVVSFGFGNQGRSLLLALDDRVILFSCVTTTGATLTCGSPTTTPAMGIQRHPRGDERICGAAISPASDVWAALVGPCRGDDDAVCLALGHPNCSAGIKNASALSFDAYGTQLAVRTTGLSIWEVKPPEPGSTLALDAEGLTSAEVKRIAFDPDGHTIAVLSSITTTGTAEGTLLSLYRWPQLTWLQSLPVSSKADEFPRYLFFGSTLALRVGDRTLAFDVRRPPGRRASPARVRSAQNSE